MTGALLLLRLPASAFKAIVPVLIGLGCILVLAQPWISRHIHPPEDAPPHGSLVVAALVFAAGVYGGYFGAAQGVLLIGILGLGLSETMQRVNAAKNVLALLVNGVAAVVFILVSHVAWQAAGLIAAGSIIGGQVGATVGRRLPPPVFRGSGGAGRRRGHRQAGLPERAASLAGARLVGCARPSRPMATPLLLLEERDLAVCLEHRHIHLGQPADALFACGSQQSSIVRRWRRSTSPARSPLRTTMTGVPRIIGRRRGHRQERVRQPDREQREDPYREERRGQGVVLLRDRLLDQVSHRHVDQQLERRDLREAGPADDPRHQPEEREDHERPQDDLHQPNLPLDLSASHGNSQVQ